MTAIRANKAKAFDYFPKPFDLLELMKRSSAAIERRLPNYSDAAHLPKQVLEIPLVGQCPAMQELYRLIARAMNSKAPVFLLGGPGTGKSVIAYSLHEFSNRAEQPFVILNPDMAESQSAVSDAIVRAGVGTLVLDGVTDFSSAAQLRVLYSLGEPDEQSARLISIAGPNVLAEIENGNFRNDLFHRISSLQLTVPALCDRVEDIKVLAEHFIKNASTDIPFKLTDTGLAALQIFGWPGNVRQLQNVISQLILESPSETLDGTMVQGILERVGFSSIINPNRTSESLGNAVEFHIQRYFDLYKENLPPFGLYQRILREVELPLIQISLTASAGNQAKCADMLGINRNTLRKKINELEIVVTRHRKMM